MSVKETIVGVVGESMLFLTVGALLAAVFTLVLAVTEVPNGYVGIGMAFVLAAGAMYTARDHLEKRRWKRLSITTLIGVIALMLSGAGATAVGATIWQTGLGFLGVSIAAMGVTLIVYVIRINYLYMMYRRKRMIVKSVESGEYSEAVKVAECTRWGAVCTDYVKSPEVLSDSVSLALSCALEAVGRSKDAERVRSFRGVRNPLRY